MTLRESARAGDSTRSTVTLKAEGSFLPATAPGAPAAKPLALKVETRVEFEERVAAVEKGGRARAGVRRVIGAAATIDGEVRPSASALRPGMALLVATRRELAVEVVATGGPMTRSELELVQGPGDPLALGSLLPSQPVAIGDRWTIDDFAARNLSGYDALAGNALEATLEAVDDTSARVRLLGSIRGAALGGEGSMACDGSFTFDRKADRVDRLTLRRAETRRPGPVEAGLDVKSVLAVERVPASPSSPLDDLPPRREAGWARRGPRTPALQRARRQVQPAPRPRLASLLGRHPPGHPQAARPGRAGRPVQPGPGPRRREGPASGRRPVPRRPPEGARRPLRQVRRPGRGRREPGRRLPLQGIEVQGRQGDAGVLWHYYLIAGPGGDQIIATFTLGLAQQAQFADQDLRLIGSLEWK